MTREERLLIEALFERLAPMGSVLRDAEAETLIAEKLEQNPGAAYAMAQAVLMQNQELAAAEARLVNLQAQLDKADAAAGRTKAEGLLTPRLMGFPEAHGFLGTAAVVALAVIGL